ncbi:MAG: T9SS type A sorting domain-containing protein [Saprospiraceae bacterium]|nr:T9SS type A sorting domain-containing protein [Saprospiraceae bacterium]MBK9722208.1 T9SS type A sorting domain-containing protein [Saprospiraceae bacterium]
MKFIFGIFIVGSMFLSVSAQKITPTVLCNAGAVMKSGNFSIEWTLGELATETLKSNNTVLTQGFHQTNLTIVSTNNPQIQGLDIYPNPVVHNLTIKNQSGQGLQFHLMSLTGQCIASYYFENGVHNLNMEAYPAGTYLLEAILNNTVQNFTIEKIK